MTAPRVIGSDGIIGTAPIFASGFGSLLGELEAIARRRARGRERAEDVADELELLEDLAELRAYYRAALRVELELGPHATPHAVALLQIEELIRDGLTLRTIAPSMLDALRRDREADLAVVLYGLDGSGGDSATTRPS